MTERPPLHRPIVRNIAAATRKHTGPAWAVLLAAVLAAACNHDGRQAAGPGGGDVANGQAGQAGAASEATKAANTAVAAELPLDDQQDFLDARRGLLLSEPGFVVPSSIPGAPAVWKAADYDFVQGEAPTTVNPSLWRQARLNGIHGLFQVADGVYQVRGYDLSNLTLVRGRTGWIVVDPLTCRETATAALALARRKLGNDPIVAVIFTHSHIDHFGGIDAVLEDRFTDAAHLRVIAPAGFMEEATSENVLAGITMSRRAGFMYGTALPRSATGHVDTGLGKAPAGGTVSILEPTELVSSTPDDREIDGVAFRFQYTPASEAPAELTFYLPGSRAWCSAELASHVMHNLYTLRGAKVRDALKWSGYLDEALRLFGDMDVVFAAHQWPTFGKERAITLVKQQRDAYKFLHDQTLRLANLGLGPREIAEQIELPSTLRKAFPVRGYYGTVRHNAKAVYQAYFGWYDAVPANLDPLPPVEEGKRYVEAMGGADAVKQKGREALARGDYRWCATLLQHLAFAQPEDAEGRELLAKAYEQLGFQAESAPWRDVYLTGALELRKGAQPAPLKPETVAGLLRHMDAARFFDAMAARLNGPKADGKQFTINFTFGDLGENHVITVENAVLHHRRAEPDPSATATVRLTRDLLVKMSTGQAGLKDLVFSKDLDVEGSRLDLLAFFSLLDRPDGNFAIVTP